MVLKKALSAAAVSAAVLLTVFIVLFVKNSSMKAYASDTKMKLAYESVKLDTQYDTYYDLNGSISGDTGSSYYVYGVDDKDVVSTNSPTVSGNSFTIRIKALKKGSTSLKICVKDTKANEVVAMGYVQVTVGTVDVSNVIFTLSKKSVTLEEGKSVKVRAQLQNYPTSLGTYWYSESGNTNCASVKWGDVVKNGTTKYRDLTINGLKQGTTTVKVMIQGNGSRKTIRQGSVSVTVDKSYTVSDIKFSLSKTDVSIQAGDRISVRALADNIPTSFKATWRYNIGNTSYVSAKWDGAQKNGHTGYDDLIITGLKAGSTTVNIQLIDNSSGNTVREGNVNVTVKASNMTLSLSKTKLDIRSGEKATVKIQLENCPSNAFYTIYADPSGTDTVYREWVSLTGDGTSGRTAVFNLYGLKPGTETVKVQIKIQDTNTILKEGSVAVTVKDNFFKSNENTSFDIKDGESFTLSPYMTVPDNAAECQVNVSAPQSISLTGKTAENKTVSDEKRKYFSCTFNASKAGTYTIELTLQIKCGSSYFNAKTLSYEITLADSRVTDDIRFTLSKKEVKVTSGDSDVIRVQADNCPTSPKLIFSYEYSSKKGIISAEWKNKTSVVNGSSRYNDIIIKGVAPGTDTVKVRLKNADTNDILQETVITVTVGDHSLDELTLTIDKTSVNVKPGGTETVKAVADNCPSNVPISFVYKLSDTEHISAEWGKVQNDADIKYADLTFSGLKIGMTNVSVKIIEKETEKVLKEGNITVFVSDSDIKFSISSTDVRLKKYESETVLMTMENCSDDNYYDSVIKCSDEDVAEADTEGWDTDFFTNNHNKQVSELSILGLSKGKATVTVQIKDYTENKTIMEYVINVTVGDYKEVTTTAVTQKEYDTTTTTTLASTDADDAKDVKMAFDTNTLNMSLYETTEIVAHLYNCPNGGEYYFNYISKPNDDVADINIADINEYPHDDEDKSDYQIVFEVRALEAGTNILIVQLIDEDEYTVIAEGKIEVTVDTAEETTTVTSKTVTMTTATTTTAATTTAKTTETTAADTTTTATAATKSSTTTTAPQAVTASETANTKITSTTATAKTTKASKTTASKTTESSAVSKTEKTKVTSSKASSNSTAAPVTSQTTVQTTKASVTTPVLKEGLYGNCGENVMWALDDKKGELVIFGEGKMSDYMPYNEEWAMLSDKIKSIRVTDGITYIGNYAFSVLTDAKKIELPSTLEIIGKSAFRATGAENITIPDSVTELGDEAFTMSLVKNVKLSSGMSDIPPGAFYECYDLESVEIPENITRIGNNAFANCTSLKSFTVPESINKIGVYAFAYCNDLSEITIESPECVIEDAEHGLTLNNTDTVIRGYFDSTAYQYAEKNGRMLIDIEDGTIYDFRSVKGDANGDGKLNVRDAAYIAKMLAQSKSDELPSFSDFNEDGKVNVRDAAAIANFLASGNK